MCAIRKQGAGETLLMGQVTSAVVPRMHPSLSALLCLCSCALLYGKDSPFCIGCVCTDPSLGRHFLALQLVASLIVVLFSDCSTQCL